MSLKGLWKHIVGQPKVSERQIDELLDEGEDLIEEMDQDYMADADTVNDDSEVDMWVDSKIEEIKSHTPQDEPSYVPTD